MGMRANRKQMRELAEELVRQDRSVVYEVSRTRNTVTFNVGGYYNLRLQAYRARIAYSVDPDSGVSKEKAANSMGGMGTRSRRPGPTRP